MATRLTRTESQARTRAALLAAAREAFLAHGYEGASLAHIADAAGCTTGAVYGNFADKDDLFLAVLDERSARGIESQAEILDAHAPLEEVLRAVARFLFDQPDDDPRWAVLVAEYWARAARNERFRTATAERHERILDDIGALIDRLAVRHGMRPAIPARHIAQGGGALARGVRLERAIGLAAEVDAATFEEMFVAYARGLLRPPRSREDDTKKGES